ncbi:fungal-specific transcription factor domain-containing protein [Mycena maculata]|uniref:Fungal-specific transcription factor domain-containing protein n=1 Tax=Mycena maculata TaxID=230809 RepID=A0AAD7HYD5_9AGAR|nr:fungal-specific transcription factor domain-containing protein [Mycena maculata]
MSLHSSRRGHLLLDVAQYARSLETEGVLPKNSPFSSSVSVVAPPHVDVKEQSELDMFVIISGLLSERFDRVKLDAEPARYFGKSSPLELINAALDAKDNLIEDNVLPKRIFDAQKRKVFWHSPWEHDHLAPREVFPPLSFPDPDLLQNLVHLFFTRVNILLFLLHRSTFEKSLAGGLHLVDYHFGCTVLGVCALAAKHTDDSRVLLEGTNTHLSAGWKYFSQLQPLRRSIVKAITLYEAQTLCLCVCYLHGTSAMDGCWVLGGFAARSVLELGVHRQNRFVNKLVAEAWKRVFWLLICIDILTSTVTTRPLAISDADYDLEYPAECDDEYWETSDPAAAFKQPPGKPSLASFMTSYLKLMEILAMAQKTIYMVKPSARPEGWPQSAVVALDSALNAWIDTVPDHLRWDPHMSDPTFATQSAILYARYYGVQIHIHRIFIPSPSNKMELSLYNYPSLAICASSARACSHVMNVLVRRGFWAYPHALNSVFDSCVVLLLHVWRGRQGGLSVDRQKCLQDIDMCLRVFRAYETRWQIAGRQHDTIAELMSAVNMDWPSSENRLKRGVDPSAEPPLASSSALAQPREALLDEPVIGSDHTVFDMDSFFSLPLYTEDLGRLPVYEPFNWSTDPVEGGVVIPLEHPGPIGDATYDPAWDNWGSYLTSVEELMSALDNNPSR